AGSGRRECERRGADHDAVRDGEERLPLLGRRAVSLRPERAHAFPAPPLHLHQSWRRAAARGVQRGRRMNDRNARVTAKGPEVVLTDATVITMDDERRAFADGYVWMKEGRIHRVGPGTELGEVPAGVTRRSFPGHIVMPG